MPDLNDVVRHVILRITVDQAGLAAELAEARAKLKALQSAEKDTNKERVKDNESVSKALKAQNELLDENRRAHEASQRATSGKSGADEIKAKSAAVKEETAAVKAQIVEEAKAEAIRKKSHQDDLDRIKQRSQAAKKAEEDLQQQKAKTAQIAESARNTKLGGQVSRANTKTESDATIARKDESAKAATEATQKRALDAAAAKKIRDDDAAAGKKTREDNIAAAKVARDNANAQAARSRAATESSARTATSRARTEGVQNKNRDAQQLLNDTYVDRVTAVQQTAQSTTQIAQQRSEAATSTASAAQSRAETAEINKQTAASRERNSLDKENVDTAKRKIDLQRTGRLLANDLNRYSREAETHENRLAALTERRAIALERASRASQNSRRQGVVASGEALAGNLAKSVGTLLFQGNDDTRFGKAREELVRVREETGKAGNALRAFWSQFKTGEKEAHSALSFLTSRIKNFITELKPASGGGGNLFKDILGNFADIGAGFRQQLSGMTQHLVSFQSLIVVVVAALGPLVAILGAVGAAALGLASNIGALAGGLLALPGLIGAAVAGFGALAIVLKPLSSVFSAYTAAQKEAADVTKQGTTAALDYKEALLNQQAAELAHTRAIADVPRAQSALNDARKQAARAIQDYRTQLQRLKFDEEGAKLGVLSSEADYRKTLADPTASALDRQIAAHNLQGAVNDAQDQGTNAKRTTEDAAEAFKKGVDGADSVVDAERSVQDAVANVNATLIAQQKAFLAVQQAAIVKDAGGTAAAQLKAQLDKLPASTRKVVEALLDLKDSYKAMQDRLSKNIFGPISGDTGKFADVLDSLEAFLTPASKAIGTFAQQALALLTNADWKRFFSAQGAESGYILQQLASALLAGADGFRAIVEQARPFTRFVVDGILGMAKAFQAFTTSDKGRDKISAFLELTRQRMSELKPVLSDFIAGLAGFFAALNSNGPAGEQDFTTSFNKGLAQGAKAFRALGDAARDPNGGFQKWLRAVMPLLGQVVHFLGQAGTFFGNLFSDPDNLREAQDLLKAIGEKWLPKLADIFDELSKSGVISKIGSAIGSMFSAIEAFMSHGGTKALSIFGDTLKFIASVIDGLLTHVPLLATAMGVLAVAVAAAIGGNLIVTLTKVLSKITGITGGLKGLNNLFGRPFNIPEGSKSEQRIQGLLQQIAANTGKDGGSTKPGSTKPGNTKPGNKKTTTATRTGGIPRVDEERNYSPVLNRIAGLLLEIASNTHCLCTSSKSSIDEGNSNKKNKKTDSGNTRARTTTSESEPGSVTGQSPVGPSTVQEGVDPNSTEGKAQRKTAAQQARVNRESRGSTPLGRLEKSVETELTPSRSSRFTSRFGSFGKGVTKLLGGLGGALLPSVPAVVDDVVDTAGTVADDETATTKRPGRLSRLGTTLRNLNRRASGDDSGSIQLAPERKSTTARRGLSLDAIEETGEKASKGTKLGLFGKLASRVGGGVPGKLAGGLLKGAAGGIGGLVAGAAASLGGDYLVDKYVKNDADANSLHRGLGAVANGAGIGATIGSVIPGVGTVIGGAIGGLAGGAYSLYKDKNLRSFVGDKIGGAAKSVGGFIGDVGDKVGGVLAHPGKALGSLFGGSDGKLGAGGVIAGLTGPLGALLGKTDIGKSIIDSLDKAGGKIGSFFTKTIPDWFHKGISGITGFFTKTLPSLPGRAFDAFFRAIGRIGAFFAKTLPHLAGIAFDAFFIAVGRIGRFFTKDLPHAASVAWDAITGFFTVTLPNAASAAWKGITGFFTETLPNAAAAAFKFVNNFFAVTLPSAAQSAWDGITGFFTETLPNAAAAAWAGITGFFTETLPNAVQGIWDNITNFFTVTVPGFFTKTLPDAVHALPGIIYSNLVQPVLDFFSGIKDHVGDLIKGGFSWVKGLFDRAGSDVSQGYNGTPKKKMSGGLIEGVYQGIQDTAHIMATPGEFMVRKGKVDQPGAKAFLHDFNEDRITMADLYGGLSAASAPQVMSMVPPAARAMTGAVPTVVNSTVNHAPVMGDVTINNPVRERSEHSLRRQVQIAAIRHRR